MMTMIGMAYVGDKLLNPVTGTLSRIIESRTERVKVFSLLNSGGELSWYGHRIFICHKCGEFQEHFHYEIKHAGGIHASKHVCDRCGVAITPRADVWFDADPSKFRCPECGKYSLEMDHSIMILWD